MPRTPIDYSKTLIYKLVHKDDLENENVYVGSTTDFRRRKNSHKTKCNNPTTKGYHYKVYQNIRENSGWDEWVMIKIEKFPCKDKRETDARERYWCEYYNSKLNMQVPGRSQKEYNENESNIERKKEVSKKWREGSVDKKKEIDREFYQRNSEDIRVKNYDKYHLHKELLNEKRREKNKEKVTCVCGKILGRGCLTQHKKTTCKSINV